MYNESWIWDIVKRPLVFACVPRVLLKHLPASRRHTNFDTLASGPPPEGVNQAILAVKVPSELRKGR